MSGYFVPVPAVGVYAGIDRATLQLWLADAQNAMHALSLGKRPVSLGYSQGDGSRNVNYGELSMADLRAEILRLQRALGLSSGRRAIGFRF